MKIQKILSQLLPDTKLTENVTEKVVDGDLTGDFNKVVETFSEECQVSRLIK